MDFAQQLAGMRAQSPEQWLKMANRYLVPVLNLALLVIVAYLAAQLTWRLVPASTVAGPLPAISVAAASQNADDTFDAARIVNRHLFGAAPRPEQVVAAPVVDEAPETTLPLRLVAAVPVEPEAERSFASISTNNGPSITYRVGQPLEGASGTRITAILSNKVMLNVNGQPQQLSYCNAETRDTPACRARGSSASTRTSTFQPQTQRSTTQPGVPRNTGGAEVQDVIARNAQRVAEIVRPSLYNQDGVTGMRVQANRNREAFEKLGFKDNDVVTEINGTKLTDATSGTAAIESLARANAATVTLIRDNQTQTITIDTTSLRSILENRE